MDYEEQFLETAQATASAMNARGKTTQRWSCDDGTAVEGWAIDTTSYGVDLRGQPGRGWWEESWGNGVTILSSDGTLWAYSFHGIDGSSTNGAELTQRITTLSTSFFVGTKGKPFEEWKARLERLPYK